MYVYWTHTEKFTTSQHRLSQVYQMLKKVSATYSTTQVLCGYVCTNWGKQTSYKVLPSLLTSLVCMYHSHTPDTAQEWVSMSELGWEHVVWTSPVCINLQYLYVSLLSIAWYFLSASEP